MATMLNGAAVMDAALLLIGQYVMDVVVCTNQELRELLSNVNWHIFMYELAV